MNDVRRAEESAFDDLKQFFGERNYGKLNRNLWSPVVSFYPLNYGNSDNCDFRFLIGDCKR